MPDKFVVLRKKYLSSFTDKKLEIESAWEKQDIERLHDLIHNLAGSSGGYGFDEIYCHCKTLLNLFSESKDSTNKQIESSIQNILLLLSTEK